jgi:hypothetical protein
MLLLQTNEASKCDIVLPAALFSIALNAMRCAELTLLKKQVPPTVTAFASAAGFLTDTLRLLREG